MTRENRRNLVASVQDRLRNLAKERGEDYHLVLTRYGLERLLYRLSQSAHGKTFVLKGAMLFQLWTDRPYRPTKDLDLLGRGDSAPENILSVFQDILGQEVEADGLTFMQNTLQVQPIREEEEYKGLRIQFTAELGRMRIPIQIDIGFGDVVTPRPTRVRFPGLLDFPTPELLAYPRETVVAEKFQAMVMLGIANSRMKDFYDLWILARDFEFQETTLGRAIGATFERRATDLPEKSPLALTEDFYHDANKRKQWQGFVKKSKLKVGEVDLEQIAVLLTEFLIPPVVALREKKPSSRNWPPRGPWEAKD
jgi:predicted nucleotidyltransferase component of viral defense system